MIKQPEQQEEDLNKEVPKQSEQPKEVRRQFTGRCFACNEIGHMKDCIVNYTNPISGYYNCYAYGHKANECRKPRFNNNTYQGTIPIASRPIGATNVIRNGVVCYKCNNFGHIARDCRL